jgi:hypothetical protein
MAFIDTFIEMRNGAAAIEMQTQLEKLIGAVRATRKAGKLTLTLAVKPATKGDDVDMVFVQDTIKADCPQPNKKETVFFVNPENQLSRQDQRQMNMLDGMKEIDFSPKGTPKEVR